MVAPAMDPVVAGVVGAALVLAVIALVAGEDRPTGPQGSGPNRTSPIGVVDPPPGKAAGGPASSTAPTPVPEATVPEVPPPTCPTISPPAADVDGDGCPEAYTVDGQLITVAGRTYEVGHRVTSRRSPTGTATGEPLPRSCGRRPERCSCSAPGRNRRRRSPCRRPPSSAVRPASGQETTRCAPTSSSPTGRHRSGRGGRAVSSRVLAPSSGGWASARRSPCSGRSATVRSRHRRSPTPTGSTPGSVRGTRSCRPSRCFGSGSCSPGLPPGRLAAGVARAGDPIGAAAAPRRPRHAPRRPTAAGGRGRHRPDHVDHRHGVHRPCSARGRQHPRPPDRRPSVRDPAGRGRGRRGHGDDAGGSVGTATSGSRSHPPGPGSG